MCPPPQPLQRTGSGRLPDRADRLSHRKGPLCDLIPSEWLIRSPFRAPDERIPRHGNLPYELFVLVFAAFLIARFARRGRPRCAGHARRSPYWQVAAPSAKCIV